MTACRGCGNEIEPILICPACEQIVQWKCVSCAKETEVSVHSHNSMITAPLDYERKHVEFARKKGTIEAIF